MCGSLDAAWEKDASPGKNLCHVPRLASGTPLQRNPLHHLPSDPSLHLSMLNDPEAPAPSAKQWSVKKIVLWGLAIFACGLTAILSYDTKLKPYDNLKPAHSVLPDATTNGFLYLREYWKKLPDLDRTERTLAREMQMGLKPWDESLIKKWRVGRETAAAVLRQALAMPEWITPPTHMLEQIAESDSLIWIMQTFYFLGLEVTALTNEGNFDAALAQLDDLQRLIHRTMEGSSNVIAYLLSAALQGSMAELCCSVLAGEKLSASQAELMGRIWREEPAALTALGEALRGEAPMFKIMIETPGPLADNAFPPKPLPAGSRLLLKKNMTLNRYHRLIGKMIEGLFEPANSWDDTKLAAVEREISHAPSLRYFLNPNFVGDFKVNGHMMSWFKLLRSAPRVFFFHRAMRVRVALYQWQAAHGGDLPATLEALAPEFLAAIPTDPWNGRPLRWDPASQTIYAVGDDWLDDLPTFPGTDRGWLEMAPSALGLRLTKPAVVGGGAPGIKTSP